MLLLASAFAIAWRTLRARQLLGDSDAVIVGACLLTAMTAFLGTSVFGDYMDEEWGYWMLALMLVYARLYGPEMATLLTDFNARVSTSTARLPRADRQPQHVARGGGSWQHKGLPS